MTVSVPGDGGVLTIDGTDQVLDPSTRSFRQLTIRLQPDPGGVCYFHFRSFQGGNDAAGYVTGSTSSGESWTFGPFPPGSGIRPSDIHIRGTATDLLYWNGLFA
jgi:hypothetical protein